VSGVDMDAKPGPDLDWDRFLGHEWGLAPKREFSLGRFFQFRCYWDYSGGIATDLFFHRLTRLVHAIGLDFPARVSAGGGIWEFGPEHKTPQGWPDDREVPDTYATTIDYPGGPTVVLLSSMCNDEQMPHEIRGHFGTIEFKDNDAILRPQRIGKSKEVITLKGEKTGDHEEHWVNFLQCVRERKEPNCPVTLGYRTNVAITLGVMAYRQEKVLRWDAKKEAIVA
jgi:predicted dehydrogenase